MAAVGLGIYIMRSMGRGGRGFFRVGRVTPIQQLFFGLILMSVDVKWILFPPIANILQKVCPL